MALLWSQGHQWGVGGHLLVHQPLLLQDPVHFCRGLRALKLLSIQHLFLQLFDGLKNKDANTKARLENPLFQEGSWGWGVIPLYKPRKGRLQAKGLWPKYF